MSSFFVASHPYLSKYHDFEFPLLCCPCVDDFEGVAFVDCAGASSSMALTSRKWYNTINSIDRQPRKIARE